MQPSLAARAPCAANRIWHHALYCSRGEALQPNESLACRKAFQKLASIFCILSPKVLTTTQLMDCVRRARTPPVGSRTTARPSAGTDALHLNFEEFLDALGRCALVAYLQPRVAEAAQIGVSLAHSYSTEAKEMWLNALLVRSNVLAPHGLHLGWEWF